MFFSSLFFFFSFFFTAVDFIGLEKLFKRSRKFAKEKQTDIHEYHSWLSSPFATHHFWENQFSPVPEC